jgi:hypothetical protein
MGRAGVEIAQTLLGRGPYAAALSFFGMACRKQYRRYSGMKIRISRDKAILPYNLRLILNMSEIQIKC